MSDRAKYWQGLVVATPTGWSHRWSQAHEWGTCTASAAQACEPWHRCGCDIHGSHIAGGDRAGRRDRTKILFWDRSGLCLYYKRIERGVFHLSSVASGDSPRVEIEAAELALLLEGIDLSHAKRRARFVPRKTA